MSAGESSPPTPIWRRPPGRLGTVAPWPLVGVVAFLVVLIVFTPQLVTNTRQPTPGILTQAELVVDKVASNTTFHFYVWALGETIRYYTIDVGVATAFGWAGSGAVNWSSLNWSRWYNGSEVLSVILTDTANPVALNITAHYLTPTANAWYDGMVALYVSSSKSSGSESLIMQPGPLGAVSVPSSVSVSNDTLPLDILLTYAGSGSQP